MRKLIAIIYMCSIHYCFFVFAFLGDEFLDSLIAKHDELNKTNIKELVRDFDVAIEKASRQGKLRELKLIENEKKDFLANPDSLPSSQFMLSSRTKYYKK